MKNVCVTLFMVRKLANELNSLPASIIEVDKGGRGKVHR